ncbi:hypothetical protein JB92DRAFT_3092785 [Gautieria morchelliformis]|nr:hypothetical protein JB92DRAFT_3092785 [Gautieria morchelliformis]
MITSVISYVLAWGFPRYTYTHPTVSRGSSIVFGALRSMTDPPEIQTSAGRPIVYHVGHLAQTIRSGLRPQAHHLLFNRSSVRREGLVYR